MPRCNRGTCFLPQPREQLPRYHQVQKNKDNDATSTPTRHTRPTKTYGLMARTSNSLRFPHLLSSVDVARVESMCRGIMIPRHEIYRRSRGVRHRIRSRHGLPYPATRRLQRFDPRCRGSRVCATSYTVHEPASGRKKAQHGLGAGVARPTSRPCAAGVGPPFAGVEYLHSFHSFHSGHSRV